MNDAQREPRGPARLQDRISGSGQYRQMAGQMQKRRPVGEFLQFGEFAAVDQRQRLFVSDLARQLR